MSRPKRNKSEQGDDKDEPRDHTIRNTIIGIILVACAFFLVFSYFQKGGLLGQSAYQAFQYLFGVGYVLIPPLLLLSGVALLRREPWWGLQRNIGGLLAFAGSMTAIGLLLPEQGGLVGTYLVRPLVTLFDVYITAIISIVLMVIGLTLAFNKPLHHTLADWWMALRNRLGTRHPSTISEPEDPASRDTIVAVEEAAREQTTTTSAPAKKEDAPAITKPAGEDFSLGVLAARAGKPFVPPPLSLLEKDRGKPGVGDIKANTNIIKRTLQNFGIIVEMDEVSIGPTVTRYALKPAEGVKLSRIVALQNDLALALAAHPIRIEAPIPGKSLVGIEIPNTTKSVVGLGNLLGSDEFQKSDKPLLTALGKGISGMSFFGNIARMPHVLIAGATGSGKSVTIHAIITSLLFRNGPEHLRMIMVDPKRVELTLYNGIPHLLTPVITDAKKAIMSLRWAAKEMDRRYDILEAEKVRDIESYHKNVLAPALEKAGKKKDDEAALPETMPYIVVVIDELADIMQTYPRELEAAVVRLAQMSRAVGIHLILSTQRPSVNVITGLIKANVPARIALQVASQIDSRTILDMSGAEKLLGAGDMLYLSGEMSQPQRIQSPYISETEVKRVTKYLTNTYEDMPPSEIPLGTEHMGGEGNGHSGNSSGMFADSFDGGDDDEMYEQAREAVIQAGKASTSYLQRKLSLGYARAARLMDVLEERGIIGPQDGAKPREVLIRSEQVESSEPGA